MESIRMRREIFSSFVNGEAACDVFQRQQNETSFGQKSTLFETW